MTRCRPRDCCCRTDCVVDSGRRHGRIQDGARPSAELCPRLTTVGALIDTIARAGCEDGLRDAVDRAADGWIEQDAGDAGAAAYRYRTYALPGGAAIGRDEHPGLFSPRIDDVGVIGIDGHLLAVRAIAVVGIVRRLLREGGLRPGCSLVDALEYVSIILHVKDVCIAVGNLDFVDASAGEIVCRDECRGHARWGDELHPLSSVP